MKIIFVILTTISQENTYAQPLPINSRFQKVRVTQHWFHGTNVGARSPKGLG